MLKYAKKKYRLISLPALKATDVLYQKMHVYNKEAREILTYLIEQIKSQNKNSPALRSLYQLMQKADDIVIDCAHKLAPYQTPKLESIEVKNKIEHRFVLRAPQQVSSVEEWMKKTGASTVIADRKVQHIKASKEQIEEPYDVEQDEIDTYRTIN